MKTYDGRNNPAYNFMAIKENYKMLSEKIAKVYEYNCNMLRWAIDNDQPEQVKAYEDIRAVMADRFHDIIKAHRRKS